MLTNEEILDKLTYISGYMPNYKIEYFKKDRTVVLWHNEDGLPKSRALAENFIEQWEVLNHPVPAMKNGTKVA